MCGCARDKLRPSSMSIEVCSVGNHLRCTRFARQRNFGSVVSVQVLRETHFLFLPYRETEQKGNPHLLSCRFMTKVAGSVSGAQIPAALTSGYTLAKRTVGLWFVCTRTRGRRPYKRRSPPTMKAYVRRSNFRFRLLFTHYAPPSIHSSPLHVSFLHYSDDTRISGQKTTSGHPVGCARL